MYPAKVPVMMAFGVSHQHPALSPAQNKLMNPSTRSLGPWGVKAGKRTDFLRPPALGSGYGAFSSPGMRRSSSSGR
ncbi:MAG TPA: hypothetical protein DCM14_07850 [Clostridiales bacterium UBA8153]|nr:hypothetical protein [Clostridiales bacterium UBA8153]